MTTAAVKATTSQSRFAFSWIAPVLGVDPQYLICKGRPDSDPHHNGCRKNELFSLWGRFIKDEGSAAVTMD
jgi:hypothetical protein